MSAARRPLIAGNWKMNGLRQEAIDLVEALVAKMASEGAPNFDMLVCPPFTLIGDVGVAIKGSRIMLGGQDCHTAEKGAHTGDVSPVMLKDLGCSHVIVGHSERRADHDESDEVVKAKAAAAHKAGLSAIICIGETEEERDAGRTLDVVRGQLGGSLPDDAKAENTVIAYEPVWAIGTGRTATAEQVQEVHGAIRKALEERLGGDAAAAMRVLYGGSMKPDNARELLALDDVDGGLIGGASLKAADFWAIAKSCP